MDGNHRPTDIMCSRMPRKWESWFPSEGGIGEDLMSKEAPILSSFLPNPDETDTATRALKDAKDRVALAMNEQPECGADR
jgi:hypothetical protein